MDVKSLVLISVNVRFKLYNSDGSLNREWGAKNQVTNVGANWAANRSHLATLPALTSTAIGSTSGGKSVFSIALEAQTAIVLFTAVATALNLVTYTSIFGPGVGTGHCEEAGLFFPMLAYVDYPGFNKIPAETLQIDWEVHYNNP